jgi:hypothetical protein
MGLRARWPAVWRRRCSLPRSIERANILSGIWPATRASCRPTHSTATTGSMLPVASPARSSKICAGGHARRKFFELGDIAANARRAKNAPPISPIALEAVKRIDALFTIEREINGFSAAKRLAARRERCAPLVDAFEGWMRAERAKLSRDAAIAKAIDYMLTRWPAFTRVLEDGRICLSNNAAERALRGLALGRKSWLFAGSERGAERAALMYTLIGTASSTTSIRRHGSPTSSPASPTPPNETLRIAAVELARRALAPTSCVTAAHAGGLRKTLHHQPKFSRPPYPCTGP